MSSIEPPSAVAWQKCDRRSNEHSMLWWWCLGRGNRTERSGLIP